MAAEVETAETLWHKLLDDGQIRSQPGLYYEPEDRHWFRQMDFGPVADCAVLYTRTFEKIDVTKYTPIFDGYLGAGNRGILLGMAREAVGPGKHGEVLSTTQCIDGTWIAGNASQNYAWGCDTEAFAILRTIEVATQEVTP